MKCVTPPLPKRSFRTGHGLKKFKAVHINKYRKDVIIVAKATKNKNKTKDEVEDTEVEDLESLEEELEELDTEDVDTDTDDDEDEDEAPKSKKKGKATSNGSKPSRSRTTDGKVGTAEIAEKAGCDARTLRMVLRKHKVEKDDETGRYEWPSFKDAEVKKILKWIADGEADDIKKESLDKLKEKKAAQKETGKKAKKNKKGKKKASDEDDD